MSSEEPAAAPPAAAEAEYFDDSSDDLEEWNAPAATTDAGAASAERHLPPPDWVNEGAEEEMELAGEKVPITFRVMRGDAVANTFQATFRMGHDISHVKAYIEFAFQVPSDRATLKLGELVCIDPLSLCDLPFKANEDNIVTVEIAA